MIIESVELGQRLKSCPLCGGNTFMHTNRTSAGDSQFWVKCDNLQCGCTANAKKAQADALAAWNRRER